jgi:DNA-binding MarR family transcriptional regulator
MASNQQPLGDLGRLTGYHLRRASSVFAADFARAMEGTGLRQVLLGILAVVSANPGINQGSVGRLLGIKRANMVSLINELIDAGLVDREVDPTDRRAFTLKLSRRGTALLKDALTRIEEHERQLLSAFTEEESRTLLDLLGRIERQEPAVD